MDRIFWKNLLKNKETDFENGVKNIQARTVLVFNYKSAYYIQQKLKNQVDILHELLVRPLKNFDPIVRLETSPPV